MSGVEVSDVVKAYGAVRVLDEVSVAFAEGRFTSLLGPSGSGKTTLLRIIGGFVVPDAGHVRIGGADVTDVPLWKRNIGMVFQSYALFPHMNVADNVAFGLNRRGIRGRAARDEVARVLDLVRLTGFDRRRPKELSGGQQQRVALARAIVTKPRVLLLDEPLSALDRRLRQDMQIELRRIQRDSGLTTIFVTHDQEEALTLSDHIAILDKGRIVQQGAPAAIYEQPRTRLRRLVPRRRQFFHRPGGRGRYRGGGPGHPMRPPSPCSRSDSNGLGAPGEDQPGATEPQPRGQPLGCRARTGGLRRSGLHLSADPAGRAVDQGIHPEPRTRGHRTRQQRRTGMVASRRCSVGGLTLRH